VEVNVRTGATVYRERMTSHASMMGTMSADRHAGHPIHDFGRLFREEGEGVWRTMCAFTGGRADIADEVTAEAFARAISHDRDLRDPLRWIYRAAFRLAIDELRRERRTHGTQPERVVDAPAETGEVLDALRRLSPNQRAAAVLRYEADLPIEEIARRMGVRPATVRVHLHRARGRLRDLLGNEETDDA
jgi:RNA polymerase sigma-70 factor (ECF subfamily)